MNTINDKDIVENQYKNSDKLTTRISLHEKYSVNKMGFGNWIISHYQIRNGMKVLELGCGTGYMWKNCDLLKECSELVLTDLSEGMLETAKANVGMHRNVTYQVADIQQIPFSENYFDAVIANMMLYHVPDLYLGLSEVRRVLKKDGTFYCATYGEHGIMEYLTELLSSYIATDQSNKNFTLQNGQHYLEKEFSNVQRLDYLDALEVTEANDIVEYIYSLSSMTSLNPEKKDDILRTLKQYMVNGVLRIPKESGMFLASGEHI